MKLLTKILALARENPVYVYLVIGVAAAFCMITLALLSVL